MKLALKTDNKYGTIVGNNGEVLQLRQEGSKIRAVYGSSKDDIADVSKDEVMDVTINNGTFDINGKTLKSYSKIAEKTTDDKLLIGQTNADIYGL